MEGDKFFDARSKGNNDSESPRCVHISEVIDKLAELHPYSKVKETTIKNLRFLADALENDKEENLKGVIEQWARTEIAMDTFMQYWISWGGVDFDEHKDKARMKELIDIGRSMIG